MAKRERGKTFLLDRIDPVRWAKAKSRAKREGRSLRFVVLSLIAEYVTHGLRKD